MGHLFQGTVEEDWRSSPSYARPVQIARLLRAAQATPLIDALDKLVARHRMPLGRFVPEGAAPRRYP